jgi:hypothetical protein
MLGSELGPDASSFATLLAAFSNPSIIGVYNSK